MDAYVLRLVVAILGLIGFLCVGFIGAVCVANREPPASLVLLAGNAIGALVGILVQQKDPPRAGGQR